MIVRPARPGDAGALAEIMNPVIDGTTITFAQDRRTPADMAAAIAARPGACLVAERESRIAGFARFWPFRGGAGYARTMEHTVMLAPGEAGQGTGRLLMEALVAEAEAAGAGSLIAAISAENPDAVAFHAAMGFSEVGRIPRAGWKFGRWIDLVLMQKLLSAAA